MSFCPNCGRYLPSPTPLGLCALCHEEKLQETKALVLDIPPGDTIDEAVTKAITLSKKKNKLVRFEFNGITLQVFPGSSDTVTINEYHFQNNQRSVS